MPSGILQSLAVGLFVGKELGHLLTSGYEFLYPNVREMIKEIHDALSELNETKKRPKIHKFIYIREYLGEQQAARFPVNADDYWFDLKSFQQQHRDIQWVKADDLDENDKRKKCFRQSIHGFSKSNVL